MKSLGKLIRERRKSKKPIWTADDLGTKLGGDLTRDKSYISKIEKGHILPSPKIMARLQELLGDDLGKIYEQVKRSLAKLDPLDKMLLSDWESSTDTVSTISIKVRKKISEAQKKNIAKSIESLRKKRQAFDKDYEKQKKRIMDLYGFTIPF